MKNKLCSILIVLLLAGTLYGCAEQAKEPEVIEVQPIVIEYPPRECTGSIVVYADGVKAFSYEGKMEIDKGSWDWKDVEIVIYSDTSEDKVN